jgi:hypothetical protein
MRWSRRQRPTAVLELRKNAGKMTLIDKPANLQKLHKLQIWVA